MGTRRIIVIAVPFHVFRDCSVFMSWWIWSGGVSKAVRDEDACKSCALGEKQILHLSKHHLGLSLPLRGSKVVILKTHREETHRGETQLFSVPSFL